MMQLILFYDYELFWNTYTVAVLPIKIKMQTIIWDCGGQ